MYNIYTYIFVFVNVSRLVKNYLLFIQYITYVYENKCTLSVLNDLQNKMK